MIGSVCRLVLSRIDVTLTYSRLRYSSKESDQLKDNVQMQSIVKKMKMLLKMMSVCSGPTTVIVFSIVFLWCVSQTIAAGLSKKLLYQAPDECRWSNENGEVILVCQLRTINSELEKTNFSVIQPYNTIRLRIQCNDAVFFQSSLSAGSFRALNELRQLSIEYCKLGNLTDGSFKGLSNLRNLTIRTHNADWSTMNLYISPYVFNDLQHLDYLDLSNNNIWSIPDGLFCPLKKIIFLNLSHNEIHDLLTFHFSVSLSTHRSKMCGVSLAEVDLSHNKLINFPPAMFSALSLLKVLNLSRNEMSSLADRSFEGLSSLTYVDLSDNKLSSLPPELFIETTRLKEIHLRNNSINVLAPGIFSDLSELLILDMSYNDLNSHWIGSATFSGLPKLAILDLSANKINKVDSTIFRNLKRLQILRIQENYIDMIPENTFLELKNLHTLVLSNNRLSVISSFTFDGLRNLQTLSLDVNRISLIDANAFKKCPDLQDLHLNKNKLKTVPDALRELKTLKTLDLGENLIQSIENTSIQTLSTVYGLRLTENYLTVIRRGVLDKLSSLKILNLSQNKIKYVSILCFEPLHLMLAGMVFWFIVFVVICNFY